MNTYDKSLVEVEEILKHLVKEEFQKIPQEVIKNIQNNKNKEYIWKYDEKKSLKEQNVSKDTLAILAYINMEYLLDNKQKELMREIYKLNDKKNIIPINNKLSEQYKLIFGTEMNNSSKKIEANLIDVKNEKRFSKLINRIKTFLKVFYKK
jgi:hypothetical protein